MRRQRNRSISIRLLNVSTRLAWSAIARRSIHIRAAALIVEAAVTAVAVMEDILPVDAAVEEAEDTLPAAVTADARRIDDFPSAAPAA
jgi:hypothetical protein